MPADPPDIPGYTLGPIAGHGGRSTVYHATHAASGLPAAVKVLNRDAATDPRVLELFRRELRAGLAVRHAHLVRVTGGNAFTFPYFLVMEILAGESLRQRLARDGALDVFTATATARQVAAGLAALHAAGLVHADIKPENIRLTAPGRAKVVDLGFAHKPGDDRELHAAGHVMGTANYLAPELCTRPPADGFPADVFSLGVTFFEMLTGTLPYPHGSAEEVVRRHRKDAPAELRFHGHFPAKLCTLVGRLMARDPAARPRAAELVRELTSLQIGLLGRAA
ncbi:MAG: serine/threonine-protein kinase [Fimbriiglobus sp.]